MATPLIEAIVSLSRLRIERTSSWEYVRSIG